MSVSVIVIGGGFAGGGAASAAVRAGAEVTLLERADVLSGLGQVAGSYRTSGQFTGQEELVAEGAPDMLNAMEAEMMYSNLELQNQHNVSQYDVRKIAKRMDTILHGMGVKIQYRSRVTDVEMSGQKIKQVKLDNGKTVPGDVFVETTGTVGPIPVCTKYGNGCVSCVVGCPTYGGRVSIAAKAGVKDKVGIRNDGTPGFFSAAMTVMLESLSPDIQSVLRKNGEIKLKISKKFIEIGKERIKTLAAPLDLEHAAVIQLTHNGFVSVVGLPWLTLEELAEIPGMENTVWFSPSKGWIGNSIRYTAMTPHDQFMKVKGLDNLFVGGEKVAGGPLGITPCVVTGVLAGHNAVRQALGKPLFEFPAKTTINGEFVDYCTVHQDDPKMRCTMVSGPCARHLFEMGLYITDVPKIQKRVKDAGLTGIFDKKLV